MKKERILVVDDEPKFVRLVSEVLTATGFEVFSACSGEQAIELVATKALDLVLLDILLLGSKDGYQVAEQIRGFSLVPIIMLSAKVRESDKLRGFETGIDDYITKPFSSKELLARIRAVLKRAQTFSKIRTITEVVCGELKIDLSRQRVTKGDQEVHLTPTEYNLLHQLASHPNQVLVHEQLLTDIWGPEYRNDFDYLRSYVHLLRRKIEPDPTSPRIIIRVPGVGYMLESENHLNF